MTAKLHKLDTQPEQAKIPGVVALSEDTLALQFAVQFGGDYRSVPTWGWMRWDSTRWVRDVALRHYDDARSIARTFGDLASNSGPDARRVASAKTVAAIVQLARADRKLVVMPDAFDADPMLLNTPLGLVDLCTGELHPHARQYVTKCTTVGPNFEATATTWRRFLDDVFEGDVELIAFMRRLLGYLLTGEVREQVLAFAFGDGRNGKSTLLDLLLWALGDYALKVPSATLMQARGERHPTDIASLVGVRLAVSNEIEEGAYWDENRLKELTGDVRLTGRFMRMDFFSFDATHKHVIAGNHRPQVRNMDAAMRRRLLLIPFNAKFEGARRDPFMLERLKTEGPAILAWMIGGAQEWNESGLGIPAKVQQASEDYAEAMDLLGLWIEECCEVDDPEANEAAGLLYRCFADWKRDRGEQPVSETRWGEQLRGREMHGRRIVKYRNNGSRYRGIRLTVDARYRTESVNRK